MYLSRAGVVAFAAFLALSAAPAQSASQIVLGGDITGTFNLGPVEFGGIEGNRIFFDRARAGASTVRILDNTFNLGVQANLTNFYSGLSGVSVSLLSGPLAGALDPSVGLLVIQFPKTSLSTTDISAVGDYVRSGGNLLLLGEFADAISFPPGLVPAGTITNGILNELLAGIGSEMRLANDTVGCCGNLITTEIVPSAFTAGISSFGYGAVSSVTGGNALIQLPALAGGGGRQTFFAMEQLTAGAVVPEPGTWAMLIAGFGLVGMAARRRTAAGAAPTPA